MSRGARSFAPVAGAIRESLYVHRLLSTRQVQALHTPGRSLRWTQRVLADLLSADLVSYVVARRREAQRLWFLTEAGLDGVESAAGPRLGRRIEVTAHGADGALQAHTLELNDVGISFAQAARLYDDECGPLAWRHEIPHPIGPRPGSSEMELVRPDAVLHYTHYNEAGAKPYTWFVELDRSTTSSVELFAKIQRYARLREYRADGDSVPLWRAHYPLRFPELLIVFSGTSRHATSHWQPQRPRSGFSGRAVPVPQASLERRMRLVCEFVAARRRQLGDLAVACALLDDLLHRGPFARVWHRPGERAAVPLLHLGASNTATDERVAA